MTAYTPNDWKRIRAHYVELMPAILAERSNEWAVDAYAWEGQGIYMTPIEQNLWSDIREANVVMYPQFPVAGVFVDFGNPVAKVAIECDGREFHKDREKDQRRDQMLADLGWTVYRLGGRECNTEFDDETRTKSEARLFVDFIARQHKVKRGVA